MRPGVGDGQPGLLDVVFVVVREIHGLGRPRRFVVSLVPNRAAQIINWDLGRTAFLKSEEERNARRNERSM